jgi:hypothetical protein
MNRLALVAPLLLALVTGTTAAAQELNLAATSTARPSIVEVRTGVDHALLGELGYLRVLAFGDQQLFVGGDVAFPWARPDVQDHRLRATVGLPFGVEHWKLAAWLSPALRGTANSASTMTALAVDSRLAGGYYARRWFVAGELGLDWVAATHITFSDTYRTQVYSGARDGWYGLPGGTIYAGFQGGVSFSSFEVILRAGHPRSTALELQTFPFYLTLGVNVTLPR